MSRRILKPQFKIILIFLMVYIFLLSIELMSSSFKLFGRDFAEYLISITSNPFIALFIGVLATSVIQSSSTTTSITIGLVAGGALTLGNAIPIVMGANIGTSVTNTVVSLGHITRKHEFERAFAGATVHDFFNILAVIILLPIELSTHLIQKSASFLSVKFVGVGGMEFLSPLKVITKPIVNQIQNMTGHPLIMLALAFLFLFFALTMIVKLMRSMVITKFETMLDTYLFRTAATAFILGIVFTSIVQSSSVTTSIIIPLVGAGVLSVRKIFPYTLGANIGTTITAMLAALVTVNPYAITVAFSHLIFNIFGVIIIYPLRKIPIFFAETTARLVTYSKRNMIIFIVCIIFAYLVPILLIIRQLNS